MTQCQAVKQLHKTVQAKAKEIGLKVEITGDYFWTKYQIFNTISNQIEDRIEILNNFQFNKHYHKETFIAIQEPQLKQIFVAFAEKLGKNPEYINWLNTYTENGGDCWYEGDPDDWFTAGKADGKLESTPQSQAEALYQKYCYDYPESAFKKDPVKVLLEVNEIIKNLK